MFYVLLGVSSHSILYHLYGDITITGEGLQILTYTRHSWPLNSEGSLTCHAYCDTGHHVISTFSSSSGSHILSSKSKQALDHNGHCVEYTFFEGITVYLDPYGKKFFQLALIDGQFYTITHLYN